METMVSSSSPTADLAAYGGERIARGRIALLVALIAALGFVAEPGGGPKRSYAAPRGAAHYPVAPVG